MKEIYKALQGFQEECPSFTKDTSGYGYKYTSLPDIMKVVTPLLKKHGLLCVQTSVSTIDTIGVKTVVIHVDTGDFFESTLTMPLVELKSMNLYQSAGSAITYIRRYDISNLLGLQSEKDDDGGSGKATYKKPAVNVAPKPVAKQTLSKDSPKWKPALEFLAKGGELSKLLDKYSLSNEDKTLLENVEKLTNI